jgi:geranylgeranyl diphosphate synthase type II
LFSETAKAVCEGQQMDMDFEKIDEVDFDTYVKMITLKTSVLLAASLQMGAVIGGASEKDQNHLYEFGKNLGIAFQIQDDYLDAFGDPEKFGKQPGGDILANKKTFLMIRAREVADPAQKAELDLQIKGNATDKVEKVLSIFKSCNIDQWAESLKETYCNKALLHLESISTSDSRKNELKKLATYLMNRES